MQGHKTFTQPVRDESVRSSSLKLSWVGRGVPYIVGPATYVNPTDCVERWTSVSVG